MYCFGGFPYIILTKRVLVSYNDRACNFLKIKDVEIILKLYIQAHEAVTLWTGRDDAETLACIRARS